MLKNKSKFYFLHTIIRKGSWSKSENYEILQTFERYYMVGLFAIIYYKYCIYQNMFCKFYMYHFWTKTDKCLNSLIFKNWLIN